MARGHATTITDEEREKRTAQLFHRLASSDGSAEKRRLANRIAELNLPLCDALANRYAGRGCDREDLVQVARLALMGAIERFRLEAETSFVGFAVPTITGELKRHFRDNAWMVRPPRAVQELRPRVLATQQRLAQEHGREPTLDDVAAFLDETQEAIRECLKASGAFRLVSLDRPAQPDSGVRLADTVPDDGDDIDVLLDRLDLRRAVRALPSPERRLLRWRFEDGMSQSQIAERLGVSQMQVSRILRALLGRLRLLLAPDAACAA